MHKKLPTPPQIKKAFAPLFKKYGVKRAALFGSVSRGEATEKSDIDVLLEFRGSNKSLLDLVSLEMALQERLGKKGDVVTYASLHPLLMDSILKEQKIIYGKGSPSIS